jgi:hypothetical protein
MVGLLKDEGFVDQNAIVNNFDIIGYYGVNDLSTVSDVIPFVFIPEILKRIKSVVCRCQAVNDNRGFGYDLLDFLIIFECNGDIVHNSPVSGATLEPPR